MYRNWQSMEPIVEATRPGFSSGVSAGPKHGEFLFGVNEVYVVSPGSPFTGRNSFTALLEPPPPSTVELLVKESIPAKTSLPPFFPSNIALIDRASKFSIFASADDSLECNSILTASSTLKLDVVKQESLGSDLHLNSSSPVVSNPSLKPSRRKERKKKDKESNKKNKKLVANEGVEDGGQNLPYVHVRARRGQATDSHSLAEIARRENINARMKLLQEMVPGCGKISGVALVLDEIINHVRALQRQVEILSMELASVDPIIDFNLDALLAADQNGSSADNSYPGMFSPFIWGDEQINGDRQQQYQHLWHFDELHHPNF